MNYCEHLFKMPIQINELGRAFCVRCNSWIKTLYQEGDMVPGVGIVEFNHCHLPYVAGIRGLYYGACQVTGHDEKGRSIFCDMKSGARLTEEEMNARLNNLKYDYLNISKK